MSPLARRLLFHAAWGVGAVLFVTVGWMAMRPWDPEGPVSLLAHSRPSMMMIQVLALAAVASAVATLLAGRDYPDIGVFASCLGLTLVSLKGGNMTALLLEAGGDAGLCWSLAAEGVFWFAVIVVSMVAAGAVARWCDVGGALDGSAAADGAPAGATLLPVMSVSSLPLLGPVLSGPSAPRTDRPTAWKHVVVVTGLSLVLIRVLGVGATDRPIHHGQACFAVAVGFYLAVGRAQAYFPVRSAAWSCFAVPVVCILAYTFSWLMWIGPGSGQSLLSIPPSSFLRALPITYVAVGTAAAIIAHWRSMESRRLTG